MTEDLDRQSAVMGYNSANDGLTVGLVRKEWSPPCLHIGGIIGAAALATAARKPMARAAVATMAHTVAVMTVASWG